MTPISIEIRKIIEEDLKAGDTHQSIADDLGIPRSSVTRIAGHIKKYGTIFPKPQPGRPPTFNDDDYQTIKEVVNDNPGCTLEEYADLIAKSTGKRRLKKSRIHQIFNFLKISYKNTKKSAPERDRDDIKKKEMDYVDSLEEGLKNGSITPENTIFIDESGVNQSKNIDRSWSLIGHPAEITEKARESNTTIIGAISGLGLLAAMYCTCSYDQYAFETFIENFLGSHLGPGKLVVMDNVPIHRVQSMRDLIESTGAKAVFLPKYHPEFNPIEMMWSKIKPMIVKLIMKGYEFGKALKLSLQAVTEEDCMGWFEHCDLV